ncbi:MAG: type I restriction-modification system subunit M N-terminal domain-containing protein [Methylococcaceae bacterium]
MAIKKSDLYSSLWASCDELRGGMDASQYKDYVLFMLFIKYVSDKYGESDDFPPVTIPPGARFKDMVDLKGKSDIGDKINTQIIQPLSDAEIKTLVIDDKWMMLLSAAVQGELDRVSQTLTGRIRQLAERYATPLPQLTQELATLSARVDEHLKKMGAVWS